MCTGFLERRACAVVEPRPGGHRDKRPSASPTRGVAAQAEVPSAPAGRRRAGLAHHLRPTLRVDTLRAALEGLVGNGALESSPFAAGLTPEPAKVKLLRWKLARHTAPHRYHGAGRWGLPRRQLTSTDAGPTGTGSPDRCAIGCGRLARAPVSPRRRAAPPRRRGVRRAGHRRRRHRRRGGARCRQPGPADRPGREGRLRLGHLVEVLQDGPRRHPLPPATRVPPGLREPGRAAAPARQRAPPGLPAARSSSRSSGATAWSPRRWPARTPPRCGSTTSPAAGASASATSGSTKDEALAHLPTLNTDHLVAGFLYFDARADDARLTLTLARTAALEFGAAVANYTPVVRLTDGRRRPTSGAVVRPVPATRRASSPIRARVVVNATGVWADDVRALDEGADPHAIRPAKGVHVTVPADRLPCDIAAVIPVPKDRRSIFVVSVAGHRPGVPRHDRHRLHGPARRPRLHPRGRRLPPRGGQRRHDVPPDPGRRDRASGPGCDRCWRPGQGRPRLGAHGRPLAPPHRAHLGPRRRHGHGRQADDLPQDGPGHRRRRRAAPRRVAPAPTLRHQVAPAHRRHHQDPGPGRQAQPHAAPPRPLRDRGRPPCSPWPTGGPSCSSPVVAGLPYTGAELLYAAREEMAQTLDDVLARRTRADDPAGAGHHGRPPRPSPPSSRPTWAGTSSEAADQAARFIESCQKELLTAGLDLP